MKKPFGKMRGSVHAVTVACCLVGALSSITAEAQSASSLPTKSSFAVSSAVNGPSKGAWNRMLTIFATYASIISGSDPDS